MKKLFLYLVAFSVLFAACNKDKDKNKNKLPSKITYAYTYLDDVEPDEYLMIFLYDGQNRMTKLSYDDGSYNEISYNSDNTLSKCLKFDAYDTSYSQAEFIYSGNLMFIKRSNWYSQGESVTWREEMDTLLLENGRVIKWTSGYSTELFTYNSNGNITHKEEQYSGSSSSWSNDYEYTNIQSIFRHANIPDWLLLWEVGVEYSKSGYMLKKANDDDSEYIYEAEDDYVSKRTYTKVENAKRMTPKAKQGRKHPAAKGGYVETEVVTYEYIDAK